jgi:NDP-sugar pyrophosphorylase family protein
MNADVLTNIDIEDFFSEFIEEQSLMSVASVPYKVNMPFAVLETAENRVLSFSEKPQYTYYTNAGIYLLKRELLSRIPDNTMYHSTDLMQEILDKGEKLTRYSMHGFWMDIGRKEDFYKAQQEIKHLYSK